MNTRTEERASIEPAPVRAVVARRWRRSRWVLLAVLALVAVGIVLAALRPRTHGEYLAPESPAKRGTRALVQITRAHGTPVTVVHSAEDAAGRMRSEPNPLLVVVRSQRLVTSDLDTLGVLQGDLLLVEPNDRTLEALAPGVHRTGLTSGITRPECGLRAATLAGDVDLGTSQTYDAPPAATACYRTGDRPALVRIGSTAGSTVTVLGTGSPLTNAHLDERGDAALGMNLLGSHSGVVWLFPDLPEPGTGDSQSSFFGLIPFGARLGALQLVIAVALVAGWRVRRLGPVVTEPLPVVVRSAETVEGRARLYRSRGARDTAAEALRAGARERLAELLGIPKRTALDPAMAHEIVTAVAARTGRDEASVGAALYGPVPVDDTELVRLTSYLDDLERQVRTS